MKKKNIALNKLSLNMTKVTNLSDTELNTVQGGLLFGLFGRKTRNGGTCCSHKVSGSCAIEDAIRVTPELIVGRPFLQGSFHAPHILRGEG